jgi:hypothetical protein
MPRYDASARLPSGTRLLWPISFRREIKPLIFIKDRRDGVPRLAQVRSDIEKIGAGEGIRTLDPDLGKVVLYP